MTDAATPSTTAKYLRWIGAIITLAIMLGIAADHVGLSVPDLVARAFGGSRLSITELQDQVVSSIVDKWQEDSATRHLKLDKLTLVHRTANEYTGVVTVDDNGTTQNYAVEVTYDGRTFVWQFRP